MSQVELTKPRRNWCWNSHQMKWLIHVRQKLTATSSAVKSRGLPWSSGPFLVTLTVSVAYQSFMMWHCCRGETLANARISSGEKWQVAILTTVQHVDLVIETPFGIEAGKNVWWKERPANVTDMVTERHDVGSQTELQPLYHTYWSNSFCSTCRFIFRFQQFNLHLDRPSSSCTIHRRSQKPHISDTITNTSHITSYYVQASWACQNDSEYTKIYVKKWCIGGETKGKFLAVQMPQNFVFSQKGSLANYFANSNNPTLIPCFILGQ